MFKEVVRQVKHISNEKYIVNSRSKSEAFQQIVKRELGLNIRKQNDITEIVD